MSAPYIITGRQNKGVAVAAVVLFSVLAAGCFGLVWAAYCVGGVFDLTSWVILGLGILMVVLVLVRQRDIWAKQVTVASDGITLHGLFRNEAFPAEGLRLGMFTRIVYPRRSGT